MTASSLNFVAAILIFLLVALVVPYGATGEAPIRLIALGLMFLCYGVARRR